jgi:NAD(P)-dependent dehydrogenase (short-subunit alcohol dehydrogenase family)
VLDFTGPMLADKTILVSGVGEGLGREIAAVAHREGARVVVVARSRDRLESVVRDLDPTGERVVACVGDVTDEESCAQMVATAVERFGGLHAVVHCAALNGGPGGILDPDWKQMRETFDVNVWGALQLTAAAVDALSVDGGAVVFIGSHSSMWPRDIPQLEYGASKGAINSATLQLARQLGPRKIRVNQVVPTFMMSDYMRSIFEMWAAGAGTTADEVQQGIANEMMLQEIPLDDDVAEAVAFMVSDRARMITGQSLLVNAGYYVR